MAVSVATFAYGYVYLAMLVGQEQAFVGAESGRNAFLFLSSFASVLIVPIVVVSVAAYG